MKVNLLTATRTVEKTMPFVFYRWLVFLVLAIGFTFSAFAGAGTAIAFFSLSANPTMFANVGAIMGFGTFGWLLYRFWDTIDASVSIPHLLLMSKLVEGESLPSGKAQLPFGKQAASDRLPSAADGRLLKTRIRAVLGALPRLFGLSLLPGIHAKLDPAVERVTAWISQLNTDVIIARMVTDPTHGPWNSARLGILRQAADIKTYSTQRAYVTLFVLIGSVVSYIVLLTPAVKIAAALPFSTTFWPYVVAGVFSWNIKASFLDPIAQAAMIQLDRAAPSAAPEPAMAARLSDALSDFREITARAAGPDEMTAPS